MKKDTTNYPKFPSKHIRFGYLPRPQFPFVFIVIRRNKSMSFSDSASPLSSKFLSHMLLNETKTKNAIKKFRKVEFVIRTKKERMGLWSI